MEEQLIEIFVKVDDFCKVYEERLRYVLKEFGFKKRFRSDTLSLSELMTIAIFFQCSQVRTFKAFYFLMLCSRFKDFFPRLPSYQRLTSLLSKIALLIEIFLTVNRGKNTGISFVDSTSIRACHFNRRHRNRVLKSISAAAKTTTGWFFGLKLHLELNDGGEILAHKLSPGNCDDRVPVKELMKGRSGLLIADRGYISDDLEFGLARKGIKLITKVKENMCFERVLTSFEKKCLRARGLIETVNDQLKNIFQIEHTRHRSVRAFFVNVLAGLAAYTFRPAKPKMA